MYLPSICSRLDQHLYIDIYNSYDNWQFIQYTYLMKLKNDSHPIMQLSRKNKFGILTLVCVVSDI